MQKYMQNCLANTNASLTKCLTAVQNTEPCTYEFYVHFFQADPEIWNNLMFSNFQIIVTDIFLALRIVLASGCYEYWQYRGV